MKHKQVIIGDYVFTPCKNAFNSKVSYWISKKGYMYSVYAFTPNSENDLNFQLSESCVNGYIRLFDEYLKGR